MFKHITSRPMRVVMLWQIVATLLLTLGSGLLGGLEMGVSALLGGLANQVADLAYALMVSGSKVRSAGSVLRILFRAEAVRVTLIILLLSAVLVGYARVNSLMTLCSFMMSVLIFRMAICLKE
ncbi:MAG: ATP synthase subunit I [Betaproteobacteria bacterium]